MEFSSTATYANRYDLDEIDIFIEGDSSNQMFFNISGLPDNLSFGKHYFTLSILDSTNHPYKLRPESKILFEFKSSNNVVLKADITDINQKNGTAICYVEVLKDPLRSFKEVEDGEGTLSVVGSLENKENSVPLIPNQYLGAMNYRCIFPIDIRKNLINADSPVKLQSSHKTSTALGQFSFASGAITVPAQGAVGFQMDVTGTPNTQYTGAGDSSD